MFACVPVQLELFEHNLSMFYLRSRDGEIENRV